MKHPTKKMESQKSLDKKGVDQHRRMAMGEMSTVNKPEYAMKKGGKAKKK